MASGSHNTNSPPPPSSDDEPIPLQDLSYRGNSPSRASPSSIGRQRSLLHGSTFGAGIGERVLVVIEGKAAGQALGRKAAPVDAAIIGIVDEVELTEPST